MIAKDKERAREHTQMLIDLRKRRAKPVKIAQERLKEQQSIRKTLERAMQGAPRSVPQLATQTSLAADVVLWHIAALKKYGIDPKALRDSRIVIEKVPPFRMAAQGAGMTFVF